MGHTTHKVSIKYIKQIKKKTVNNDSHSKELQYKRLQHT